MDKKQIMQGCYTLLKDITPIIESVKENNAGVIKESKDYITEKYRLNNYNLTYPEKIKISAVPHLLQMSV